MAKRGQTKAQEVLRDAGNRRDDALRAVRVAEQALQTAQAVLKVHEDTYFALEKSLAREPRKKSTKKGKPGEPLLKVADAPGSQT
jgi:hypothetical protein